MINSKKISYHNVSVVIPCYRCADTIERALDSIINQSFQPYEIILVDDHSQDEMKTSNKLKEMKLKYKKKIKIKILVNRFNCGPGFSRNKAWNFSSGNFVAFLDADDTWHFKKLEMQLMHLKINSQIDAICSFDKYNLDYKNKLTEDVNNIQIQPIKYTSMLFKNIVSTRSVLIKKEVESRFNPNSWYSEDYWLWLDLLHKGYKISRLPLYLSGFYKKPNSKKGLSSNLFQFFLSEFSVIKVQPSISFTRSLVKLLALSFCIMKFCKRILLLNVLSR